MTKFKIQMVNTKNIKLCHLSSGIWYCFVICALIFVIYSNAYALSLDKLKIDFLKGDYKAAITEGEKILAANKQSSDLEELYYILGLSYLKDGNLLRASDIFEIILKEFKDGKLKDEAALGLADTYFLRGDYEKASQYYKELVKPETAGKLKAQAYSRLSQAAFKQGSTQEGKEYLDKLNREYPLNLEAKLNKEVSLPSDFYTVQVGSFGNPVNANNFSGRLIKEGYDAYVQETEAEGKKSYRVRVGKLSSRSEAVKLENKLSSEGYPTKIAP
jgi:tetratricopeptide (TPR) repeat protein